MAKPPPKANTTFRFPLARRGLSRRRGTRTQIFFKKNIATGLSGTAQRRGRGTREKNEKKGGAAVVNLAAARLHNSAIMIAL